MTPEYKQKLRDDTVQLINDAAITFNCKDADSTLMQLGAILVYHRRFFNEKDLMTEYQEWAMEEEMRAQNL